MPSTFDYNPQAKIEVKSFDVPYQKALGEPWEATIHQLESEEGRFLASCSSTAEPGTQATAHNRSYSTLALHQADW
jgi:hypothetical protein